MTSLVEERALELLGQGLGPETVASALGVSTSLISQYLSAEEFSKQVAELRYKNLAKHNTRDNEYDKLEDKLLSSLDKSLVFMSKPMEIARVLQLVNAAKRRGSSAPEHITNQRTVVQLTIPMAIMQKFSVNVNNQVIQAGDQQLVTIQSSALTKLLEAPSNERTLEPPAESNHAAA